MRSASATSSFSSPLRSRPNSTATVLARRHARRQQRGGLARRRSPAWPGRAARAVVASTSVQSAIAAASVSNSAAPSRMRSAPEAERRAWMLGQPSRGLTSRSRARPKFAMARAAAPMFSPSCGSTRITIGPGRLDPVPGLVGSCAGHDRLYVHGIANALTRRQGLRSRALRIVGEQRSAGSFAAAIASARIAHEHIDGRDGGCRFHRSRAGAIATPPAGASAERFAVFVSSRRLSRHEGARKGPQWRKSK